MTDVPDAEWEWAMNTISLLRDWCIQHDEAIAEIRELLSRPRGGQPI